MCVCVCACVCVCVAGQLLNVVIIDCFLRLTSHPVKCQEMMMNACHKFRKTKVTSVFLIITGIVMNTVTF